MSWPQRREARHPDRTTHCSGWRPSTARSGRGASPVRRAIIDFSCGFQASLSSGSRSSNFLVDRHLVIVLSQHRVLQRHSSDSVRRFLCAFLTLGIGMSACRRQAPPSPPGPPLPQVSGTLAVPGLTAPVRVLRDTWGVPHIYAETQADLFFAQGFVQAQDRLFQMDLWRRSAQGRLSEVLGPNFIERDAMTRRMQYHGDMRAEWDSYGADTEAIATAFVRGVNAWIDIANERLPEEFGLAGWRPEHWRPEDLLNRTDAFVASANAADEVFHARLVASVGCAARRSAAPRPLRRFGSPSRSASTSTRSPTSSAMRCGEWERRRSSAVSRRPSARHAWRAAKTTGTEADPYTVADAAPLQSEIAVGLVGSNAWAVSGARSATGAPLLAADPHIAARPPVGAIPRAPQRAGLECDRRRDALAARCGDRPQRAPGLGDDEPRRGRSGSLRRAGESGESPSGRAGGTLDADRRSSPIPLSVKRREKPFPFEREFTSHGVIIASDRARHLAFTVRWIGFEPGTAADLGIAGARSRGLRRGVSASALPLEAADSHLRVMPLATARSARRPPAWCLFAERGTARYRFLAGPAPTSGRACPRSATRQQRREQARLRGLGQRQRRPHSADRRGVVVAAVVRHRRLQGPAARHARVERRAARSAPGVLAQRSRGCRRRAREAAGMGSPDRG